MRGLPGRRLTSGLAAAALVTIGLTFVPRTDATGERDDSLVTGPGTPGCASGPADEVVDRPVLGVTLTGASCFGGLELMAAYHGCLRAGGDEATCRVSGPQVRPDTARIDQEIGLPASPPLSVATESELRAAWADPFQTSIRLARDIFLQSCLSGGPIRESPRPMMLDGRGFTLRQTCFEKRPLRQDATGFLLIKNITITRGGNDGPGAAITTRGEIVIEDSVVHENLAEEPGGAVFSQRRATVIRSIFTGNFAWDDGGAVYARRGGVEVFDSIFSNNLVDGSGGAIGTTGDILVVRSHVDGNTTDGDGGALYADEDGDITVIDSTVDGNTADGPGGAIFTLEGDVTIVNSTLNGNRADDRGGAISGEADVVVVGSTIARNVVVAHVGGGIWARSDAYVINSTVSNNYAEGSGGGIAVAGTLGLAGSSVLDNISPLASSVSATRLLAFGSVIGPPNTEPFGGEVQPTGVNCRVAITTSFGYNVVSDTSCGLGGIGDVVDGRGSRLAPLAQNGGLGETRLPLPGSPVIDVIPIEECAFVPFGEPLEGEQHVARFGIDLFAPIVTDQRGFPRPQGGGCDAGAVELDVTS